MRQKWWEEMEGEEGKNREKKILVLLRGRELDGGGGVPGVICL